MKHLRAYQERDNRLITVAEGLLGHLPWWTRAKRDINPNTIVEIDVASQREEEAHFDATQSTPSKIIIQMAHTPRGRRDEGTLAHELTHAIQWLSGDFGDLMFITDATRDLLELSDSPIWEKVLHGIYLSCPQETQAWEAEALYYREPLLDEMVPWMRSFDPIATAQELQETEPLTNRWEIKSFDELPAFWAEAYEAYGEISPDSKIPSMGALSLEEWLQGYSIAFKETARTLA